DLAKIVERREICLFEHEHSIYLTALTLNRLLERCGFELVSDTLLPDAARRGNSLLVAAAPRGHTHRNADYRPRPGDAALEEWETYQRFGNEVWQGIERLRGHLAAQRAAGRRVAGYGAGGRGVWAMAMAGLTRAEIAYLADQNPSFHGLFTPATHIPVVSPEHIRSEPVDELVVFSYAYLEEIRARVGSWAGKYTSILELM